LEHVDEENYTSRVSDLANVEASEEHIQSVPPVSGQNKLKIFKIDKSKIKMSNKEEVTSSQSKIKLKLNNIKKQTSSESTAKLQEQTKLLEQQQLEKNMEYQK